MKKRISKKEIQLAVSMVTHSYATHKNFTAKEWLESNALLKYNTKAKETYKELKGIFEDEKK
jgi:hypothetical protein